MNIVDYKIESKSDLANGAYVVAKIPLHKVDKNALYTLSADPPRFTLPFTYKNVDGEMEITYQVGNLSKLAYFTGELNTVEYAELWTSLLEPLLDCGDWFLTANSFLLSLDNLYYDKKNRSAVYIYVPSIEGKSDEGAFAKMAAELSKIMTTSDMTLENKVLRLILESSSPRELHEKLKEHLSDRTQNRQPETQPYTLSNVSRDELIGFGNVHGERVEQVEKEITHTKKESGRFKMFGAKSKRKKEIIPVPKSKTEKNQKKEFAAQEFELQLGERSDQTKKRENNNVDYSSLSVAKVYGGAIDVTESVPLIPQSARLKCVGKAGFPQLIEVNVNEGEIFSIGRYDAAVGKAQSTFEFDKKTKAVSRRHAVIERKNTGYTIIDLSSKAGTFVDGQKLPPNTPYELTIGTGVSFGNFGADYVWDVS